MAPTCRKKPSANGAKLVASLLVPLLLASAAASALRNNVNYNNNNHSSSTGKRYELKFQLETDNSTIVKHELEQQIFKCQIRLAQTPTTTSSSSSARLRSSVKPLGSSSLDNITNLQPAGNKLANLSLAIDWLHDDRLIAAGEQVALVNVELRGNSNNSSGQSIAMKNDKIVSRANSSIKSRIEIKNTLNGQQMKLSSRLKLTQLRQDLDSGQYRCVARASFIQLTNDQSTTRQAGAIAAGSEAASQQPSAATWLQVEQTLEPTSSGVNLVILSRSNATSSALHNSSNEVYEPPADNAKLEPWQRASQKRGHHQSQVGGGNEWRRQLSAGNLDIVASNQRVNDTRHANGGEPSGSATSSTMGLDDGYKTSSANSRRPPLAGIKTQNGTYAAASDERLRGRDNNELADIGPEVGGIRQQSKPKQSSVQLSSSLFADDEDLFRLDQQRAVGDQFISSGQRRVAQQTMASGDSNSDDEDDGLIINRRQPEDGSIEYLSKELATTDELLAAENSGNESSLVATHLRNYNNNNNINQHQNQASGESPEVGAGQLHQWAGSETETTATNYSGGGETGREQQRAGHYFSHSLDSTKRRLVKLVQRIAPELSCYTGLGEHYRGNISTSADGRQCISWPLARRLLSQQLAESGHQAAGGGHHQLLLELASARHADRHNHCRNPNGDPRGPWCFVRLTTSGEQPTDGGHPQQLPVRPLGESDSAISGLMWTGANRAAASTGGHIQLLGGSTRYVASACSVSACSEYLWLYIVAPPLGLLMLISCLTTVLIRSVRRSRRYKSMVMFGASGNSTSGSRSLSRGRSAVAGGGAKGLPKLGRLLRSRAARKWGLGAGGRGKKLASGASYLEEDVFEIVDDLDWSSGAQTASSNMSPNSTSESLKELNSASFSSSCCTGNDLDARLISGCKSHHHLSSAGDLGVGKQKKLEQVSGLMTADLLGVGHGDQSARGSGTNMSRSITQVGPMFATLRCQIRGSASRPNGLMDSNRLANGNKSSNFIEQSDLATTTTMGKRHLIPKTSHLISCSSVDSTGSQTDGKLNVKEAPFVRGIELPQVDPSTLVLAKTLEQQQPIYEGKFNQVLWARLLKQNNDNNIDSEMESDGRKTEDKVMSSGPQVNLQQTAGTQVAVCVAKQGADIDPFLLDPSNLRLRNLNHLNLIRLIGYARLPPSSDEINPVVVTRHSLLFDMAQLVDLSDWLKQQNKDLLLSNNDIANDSRVKRNLTCFAKQLALAIDYLHDRDIVYKDLACRNCFLDPTKMLIKLASFNIELVNSTTATTTTYDTTEKALKTEHQESIPQSLTKQYQNHFSSMIRPKYLLDYYVIDSRPADCQLLPLSWIPLESILFNKFNKQTDIWSFGCLLYELFSLGKVAYFGYSSKQVIDAVRSNLMPPQPLLCPNGIYQLMCKCLSDIPTTRPNVKQIYEQLNLYSGQCSSFLDHHLCSLATTTTCNYDNLMIMDHKQSEQQQPPLHQHLIELKTNQSNPSSTKTTSTAIQFNGNSITKTKSYANIKNFTSFCQPTNSRLPSIEVSVGYDSVKGETKQQVVGCKIPLSKSVNLGAAGARLTSFGGQKQVQQNDGNHHYDEPIINVKSD